MTEQEFVQFVRKECKYYGVDFKIGRGSYVRCNGSGSSGYFDMDNRVIACAKNNKYFLGVLAHEYCHMRQWIEKADAWVKAIEEDSYVVWDKHITGKKVDMNPHFDIMRDLELDNEKRTVALIKELDLPIDVSEYIKRANIYVMFYNYMKITGKWYKVHNNPCKNKRLIAAVPDRFSLNYNKLPKRLEKIFREEGI